MMYPLDTHAHLVPDIARSQLSDLKACVVAVTRSPIEFESVQARIDPETVWALGCHPGLVRVQRAFSEEPFERLLSAASIVGEIGLDGGSRVPMPHQREVFRAILKLVAATPRLMTIHSYRATQEVVEDLKEYPSTGAILHWWLGDAAQTRTALDLGSYFSINASSIRRDDLLALIPIERVLTETDHPFGDRWARPPRRPGHLEEVENRLALHYGVSRQDFRRQVWVNFGELLGRAQTPRSLPSVFESCLHAARES